MASKVISASSLPIDMCASLPNMLVEELGQDEWQRSDLLNTIGDADALISLLSVQVDEELMQAAPMLKVIANYAVGYDNIDVQTATSRGIVVTNTPDVLTEATADSAFGLLLSAARRIGEGDRLLRAGEWTGWAPKLLLGGEVFGKTMGVLGAGRIGTALLRRARGFFMELCYCGPRTSLAAEALGARRVSMDALLSDSDFISLHCPVNVETKGCMDRDSLAKMKPHAILVNTARGPIVDYDALDSALNCGEIAGAGIDVFDDEPTVPNALLACRTALLTPHIGSATLAARQAMARICVEAFKSVLQGKAPDSALNPEVLS